MWVCVREWVCMCENQFLSIPLTAHIKSYPTSLVFSVLFFISTLVLLSHKRASRERCDWRNFFCFIFQQQKWHEKSHRRHHLFETKLFKLQPLLSHRPSPSHPTFQLHQGPRCSLNIKLKKKKPPQEQSRRKSWRQTNDHECSVWFGTHKSQLLFIYSARDGRLDCIQQPAATFH